MAEKDRATNASDVNGRTVDESDRTGRAWPDAGQAGRVMRVLTAEQEHLTGDVAAVLDLLPYPRMREEQSVG